MAVRSDVEVIRQIDDQNLLLGIVEVLGGKVTDASEQLKLRANQAAETVLAEGFEISEDKRSAVRKSLKSGGFSPTGRNRPAHEFLVRDVQERGSFNHINNVVDVNNVFSLESLLPISIFDSSKLMGRLIVRIGREGESYVFNPSGHVLDVKRCVVCCRGDGDGEPVGTPVKDSMETKVFDSAAGFLAVIYGNPQMYPDSSFSALTESFALLLAEETGGQIAQNCVL